MNMKTIHIIASVVAVVLVLALVAFIFIQKPITAVAPIEYLEATTTAPIAPAATSTTVTTVTTVTTKPATTTPATTTPAIAGTPITVHGSQVCLPFKDETGVHIMLCAIGLKTSSGGKYYSLHDTSADYSNLSSFSGEGTYEIKGTFTPKEDPTFVSEGVIDVESVRKI